MGLFSRLITDGDAVRRWRENQSHHSRTEFIVTLTVVALTIVLQVGAMVFYLVRFRRCDSVTGFLVFILVSGLAGFLMTAWIAPSTWHRRRCPLAPPTREPVENPSNP